MYEGPSFSQRYENYCNQRQRRRRRTCRLACTFSVLVFVISAAVILSDGMFVSKVWATPEKSIEELETAIAYDEIINDAPEEEEQEESAEPEKERRSPVIFIDAGHGGNDGGCFEGDIIEKNINLSIAERVRDKLTDTGFQVIMSRKNDTYVAKEDRVKRANAAQADIYVSIHQNS